MNLKKTRTQQTFIDLFSGCGGLSLGLCQAGWKGQFAIERATDAFETFRSNFLAEDARFPFEWPTWLEQKANSIDEVLKKHRIELLQLRGSVDLVAGGPPCQGFSFAGRRKASDPRNKLSQRYVDFVELVQPKFLVLENVPGMNVAHKDGRGKNTKTYYQKLLSALSQAGYVVSGQVLDAANFAVPQRRTRLIAVGIRSNLAAQFAKAANLSPIEVVEAIFDAIKNVGFEQLSKYADGSPVSVSEAISDLTIGSNKILNTVEYTGEIARRGYRQVRYQGPITPYQIKMSCKVPRSEMDSMRLAKHSEAVKKKFDKIQLICQRGVNISADIRAELGMLKQRTVPMHPDQPAPTLTTLPDDIIHYSDPRILTVREYARIQSFPDWFRFKGKYTTGGESRRTECPRYTQVGNAVPPLLADAIGTGLRSYIASCLVGNSAGRHSSTGMADKETLGRTRRQPLQVNK